MNIDIKTVYTSWLRQCFHTSSYSQEEDRVKKFYREWKSGLVGHIEPIGRLYVAGMPKV
jgi:predicted GIY-YIG superfamily endonuclease